MDVDLGRVVLSIAGRDAGRVFVVVGRIDDKHVLISDGDLRRIEKPKKKKIKHIKATKEVILPLKEKLSKGDRISNSEIRKALAELENEKSGT
ncbi:MAG TPA: RNA-binding protein [Ruminiclostridium sp.]|jgi:ribosomal protein L14E/L6E/L27E|uniref:50S ribosomal protein L14e n=1 Tax=Acetivibrio saccincola TaxID=1677857 RepID=A0A2K9EQI7_9FIRM|nr:RNA-binding protein [Acetivibrio saccincola]HAA43583.1 RNA-binding protein [Ruminiclostridium sp.]AUG58901.1 50S ribosomal protein L14e [Acetivibrio saccincola]NLW26432.1 RNA-binding protein [Acetivibrio saccincola]PQQ66019.1 KOW domain-containing protein [Acetivibrio saccincola]HQD29132.1 RNA-binding protein [Acetivibrio saccincola]